MFALPVITSDLVRRKTVTGRYRRKDEIPGQAMGKDLMVFDPHTDRVHILNGTAAFIWGCLGDETDAGEIGRKIESAYDIPPGENVLEAVTTVLGNFVENGLIETVAVEREGTG